ncbi:MAG: monovalent cation/H+ antiporter complex subunit F [Bacteroidetes bacterium]|jgi:multisubunit Na+/H+ antiporter MnhF subunit|nr:monovalent cation/H+ antiporter complex subunit F [Bacteroidota bacterium]
MDTTYSLFDFAITFSFFSITVAFLAVLYRLIKGPEITDRLIVLDLAASSLIGLVLLVIIFSGKSVYLNVALITGLIIFMGNIAFARYLKKTVSNERNNS